METLKFKDMQFRSKVKVENPDIVTSLSRILVTPQKLQSLFIMSLWISYSEQLSLHPDSHLRQVLPPSLPPQPPLYFLEHIPGAPLFNSFWKMLVIVDIPKHMNNSINESQTILLIIQQSRYPSYSETHFSEYAWEVTPLLFPKGTNYKHFSFPSLCQSSVFLLQLI